MAIASARLAFVLAFASACEALRLSRESSAVSRVAGMDHASQEEVSGKVPLLVDAFLSASGLEVYVIFVTKLLGDGECLSFQTGEWGCLWDAERARDDGHLDTTLVQTMAVISDLPDDPALSLHTEDKDSHEEIGGAGETNLTNTTGEVPGADTHKLSLVLKCRLPPNATGVSNLTVTVKRGDGKQPGAHRYEAVPVSGNRVFEPSQLAMCTMMVKSAPVSPYLRQWVAYHLSYGFEQIVIYVEDSTTHWAQDALRTFISEGRVRLVHFYFPWVRRPKRQWFKPSPNFFMQQAQEQHCLYQAKGRVTWLAHADADEYFQLMQGTSNMRQFLEAYAPQDVVAIAAQSQFWYHGWFSKVGVFPCDLTCKRDGYFPKDKRTKLILSTQNVMYFSVHMVTGKTSGEMVFANPVQQLRLNHFKRVLSYPNDRCNRDLSFQQHCKSVLAAR